MTEEKFSKIGVLERNIERFDHYISTTNAKSSIILAFNGIIIGSIFFSYDVFLKLFEKPTWSLYSAIILFSILGISSIISIIYAFRVINPFLESGHNDQNKSLFFFKSISEMTYEEYKEKLEQSDVQSIMEDLKRQTHQLAIGLAQKSRDTTNSVKYTYCSLGIVICLLILKGVISCVNV
ncbi:MAG: Pycsar system effector family protein [Candidatus Hodarchaeales archaeon]|jgi:uncharacterized membrane protein YuzA (DUF378 family)